VPDGLTIFFIFDAEYYFLYGCGYNVIFQYPVALYRPDFWSFLCHLCSASFTILYLHPFIGHYMFQPNWPSSGVPVVKVKDSAAHRNAVFFPPIVVASGYFRYVGYHQIYLGVCGLHMVAFL
jgi:hypothetical protein